MTTTTLENKAAAPLQAPLRNSRGIVLRTRGKQHGPITRLMSPSDLGELVKPFIFLDLFSIDPATGFSGFPMHPHSGIATVTYLMQGDTAYEDSTGKSGVLPEGGVEWMMAGGGVWHKGGSAKPGRKLGFQLWLAMPPELENAPALSQYVAPSEIQTDGPATVLIGAHGVATSVIAAPSPLNYFAVQLKAGARWQYQPPRGHSVAWVALSAGRMQTGGVPADSAQAGAEPVAALTAGEMAVFEESAQAIEFTALQDTAFMLGSAAKHPHDLVTGYYSVHTSHAALQQGEAGIARIGQQLRAEGRL